MVDRKDQEKVDGKEEKEVNGEEDEEVNGEEEVEGGDSSFAEVSKAEQPTTSNEGEDTSLDEINNDILESAQFVTYLQYPLEFTSEDWQNGLNFTNWKGRQRESTHSEGDFHIGVQYEDKFSDQRHVKLWHIKNSHECITTRTSPL